MRTFNYEIKDEIGIHARPAGMLAKKAKQYESKVVIRANQKSAEAAKLMAVMALGVKSGEKVEVEITGADEDAAYEGMKQFFETSL